jgi:hypothetical protein
MDLATNASVVSNALTHVNGKAEKLGQQVKAEKDSASKSDSDEEEESSPLVWVDHIDKSKKL